jgi:hypothetical protein
LRKIDIVTKVTAGYLRHQVTTLNVADYLVQRGVVFSAQPQSLTIHDPLAKDHVFLLPNLCDRLLKLDQRGGSDLVVVVENKQRVHYITQHEGKVVRSDVPLR